MPDKQTEYVVGFMFNRDRSEVALIEKLRPAWQRGRLNGIGGHVKTDEPPAQAMIREFLEETGYQSMGGDWQRVCVMLREGNFAFTCHVFRFLSECADLRRVIDSLTDERVGIYSAQCLPSNVLSNVGWLIGMCLDTQPGDEPYDVVGYIGPHLHAARVEAAR
jgi:8-oxo-dGTP diphosphatase